MQQEMLCLFLAHSMWKREKAAQAPAAPDREGYEFTGWNPATFSEVTDNLDVYAQYVAIAGQVRLTVNYVYSDGTMAAQPWVSHVKIWCCM